jgi:putative PIN family toxin of toxin-antitoxin system
MLMVMDTDVVVAALRSPTGASAALLRRVHLGQLRMAASVSLFTEYEAVCQRPEHAEAAGLSSHQIGIFLDAMAKLVEPVPIHFRWRPQLRDPGDELVLEAAVNAGADVLLSFNQKHFSNAAHRFGLQLPLPGPFLRSLS